MIAEDGDEDVGRTPTRSSASPELAAARAAARRGAAAGLRPAARHGQGPGRRPAAEPGEVASRSSDRRDVLRRDRRRRHRRRRRRPVRATLERAPALLDRLFTPAERGRCVRAARFAAKEALAKALGAPAGLWQDAECTAAPTAASTSRSRHRGRGRRRLGITVLPRVALARRRDRLGRRPRRSPEDPPPRPARGVAVIEAWRPRRLRRRGVAHGDPRRGASWPVRSRVSPGSPLPGSRSASGAAVAALVGPGNNGADALFAVARLAEAGLERRRSAPRDGPRGSQGRRRGCRRRAHHRPVGGARGRRRARRHPRDRGTARAAAVGEGVGGAVPETAHLDAVDLPSGQAPRAARSTPTASSPTRR